MRRPAFGGEVDFRPTGIAVSLCRERDRLTDLRIAITGINSRPLFLTNVKALIGRPVDNDCLGQIGEFVQRQVALVRTMLTPAHYWRCVAAAMATRLTRRLYAAQGKRVQ